MTRNTITLTPEQTEAFGRELDALKQRVVADLGERDASYIRRVIRPNGHSRSAGARC